MGFLEIGKLIKNVADYGEIQQKIIKLEIASQKEQLTDLFGRYKGLIFLFLALIILALVFVFFVFLSLAFLVAYVFNNSYLVGFSIMSGVLLVLMLLLFLVAQRKMKKPRKSLEESPERPRINEANEDLKNEGNGK